MIEMEHVNIEAGAFTLRDVNLSVPDGLYAVLMGRTGSGKTTILESICGLRRIRGGRIVLDGLDVTDASPGDRNVGLVPQDAALFTTMTVRQHLEFALVIRGAPSAVRDKRVDELADLLGIEPLLHRMPDTLSGGERQRVALGRALSFNPRVLLLDEPLSALDEDTHESMCELLLKVRDVTGASCLHITHTKHEARRLADKMYHLEDGRLHAFTQGA